MIHQILGKVRSGDDGIGKCAFQILILDRIAVLGEKSAHFAVSVHSGVREFMELFRKFSVLPVHEQADDMDILPLVLCGEFNARDHFRNDLGGGSMRRGLNGPGLRHIG